MPPRASNSWLAAVVTLGLFCLSCSAETVFSDNDSGVVGDGGTIVDATDDATMPYDTSPAKPCNPPCNPPQVCSHAGACIDPGTCIHNEDCQEPLVCDPQTSTCVVQDQCGATELQADIVPPNLLIVLDRSCSMKKSAGTESKWKVAVDALVKLTTNNTDKIRFGLSLFPDTTGEKCAQDAIAIPVGPGNESAIQTLLTNALDTADDNWPDGPCVTNIDTAMEQAAAHPPLKDQTRDNFALLITDGKQAGCDEAGGDDGTTQIITDMLQNDSIATFVVGFGDGVDPNQLNIFADAGGVPTSDPNTRFYDAADQASLDQALAAIAKKAFGCVLTLEQVPETVTSIYVFFDDQEVPRDPSHQNGWDYDPNTNKLTFYGQACQDLQDSKVKDLDIVYGCKKPVE